MQICYFLTAKEHFEYLKQAVATYKHPVGICFRRFIDSGLDARYEIASWEEPLSKKFIIGKFSQVFLTTNNSSPLKHNDWDFIDREQQNIIEIRGGRLKDNELEQNNLRVISKKNNCKTLYQKIRKIIKESSSQGLYTGPHFNKTIFYSSEAKKYRMFSSFGGHEYSINKNT